MPKKREPDKLDGLSPENLLKIRNAIRLIWSRSYPHKLAKANCTDKEGFPFCEKCFNRVPKVQIDHIEPVGDLLKGGIERMFCPSIGLRGLCKECHKKKTKEDKDAGKTTNKKRS
ncbi:hnh endonuclease [Caudoviricetes sp.]|nr:hnh endonuclease [Caudoviricetes sp.]UOF79110.1 hnh endonuclease [Caudoviricetes sp.]